MAGEPAHAAMKGAQHTTTSRCKPKQILQEVKCHLAAFSAMYLQHITQLYRQKTVQETLIQSLQKTLTIFVINPIVSREETICAPVINTWQYGTVSRINGIQRNVVTSLAEVMKKSSL